jgi:Tol biopolymer transport system component
VFDRLEGNPEGRLIDMFTLGADGEEHAMKVSALLDFAYGVWSTDGHKLLVNSFASATGSSVGILDLGTGQETPIAPKGLGDGIECSDWSPDGTTLVCSFGSSDKTRDGIYLVDIATSRAKRLTTSPFHDTVGTAGECGGGESRGVFSPDGKQIAYEQQRCGTGPDPSSDEAGSIVVIGADDSPPHVVVPFGGVRTHPGGEISWSPDGKLIAYGTQSGELSVVAPDGSGDRRIALPPTVDGSFAYGPAWSPDGEWLLVAIRADGPSDLYAVAPDASAAIRLTHTGLAEAYTDWGPAAN